MKQSLIFTLSLLIILSTVVELLQVSAELDFDLSLQWVLWEQFSVQVWTIENSLHRSTKLQFVRDLSGTLQIIET